MAAIVVPLSMIPTLTDEEQISFRHLNHYLGKYDIYLLTPQSLQLQFPTENAAIKRFPNKYFGSVRAHAKLLFSPIFYQTFIDYEYILMYHLDSLVLSDRLQEWCETGIDYIGAPWIICDEKPWVKEMEVGNGGFALCKVRSFLNVILSDRYHTEPDQYWANFCQSAPKYKQYLNLPKKYLKRLKMFNGVKWHMSNYLSPKNFINVDEFWSREATRYDPDFKVAPFEMGLRFAFETVPRQCFEMNNREMPFGCHAWHKFDREFWEPYLLQ